MPDVIVDGGWYGDSLPGGQTITLVTDAQGVPTHLESRHSADPNAITRIDFHQNDRKYAPLFPRLREDAGAFAGQCHNFNNHAIEFMGLWTIRAEVAWGVSPVIYDLTGLLRIAQAGGPEGSGGYRNVAEDGTIVLGDWTIAPTADTPGLWQFTRLGRPDGGILTIGQGADENAIQGGVLVYDGKDHRVLASGRCLAIRARRWGDQCNITYYQEIGGPWLYRCTHTFKTVADLLALPILPAVPVPPVIAPNVPNFPFLVAWWADQDWPGTAAIGSKTYTAPKHPLVIAESQFIDSIPEERRAGLLVYLDQDDATDLAKVKANIPIASALRLPMFIYQDREVGQFDEFKTACGFAPWIWMPQTFLNIGEDPKVFASNAIKLAQSYGGHPFMPVIRGHTAFQNTDPDPSKWYDAVPEAQVIAALNELILQGFLKVLGLLGPSFFAWLRFDGFGFFVNGKPTRPLIYDAIVNVWMKIPITVTDARAWADTFFPEAPTMNPDRSQDALALYNTGAYNLESKPGSGIYADEVVRTLRETDSRWHHLKKNPGQNQYNGHAVDAILYLRDAPETSTTIDLISGSEEPGASPGWNENTGDKYTSADALDPGPWPKSAIVRPPLPEMLGMSGFDWCTHCEAAWLDLHLKYKLPFIRVVPQSVFRTFRSLDQGLAQFDFALPLIAAKGMSVLVTMNCDTKEPAYNMSEQDVGDNTVAMNAIMVKHLGLFNESKGQYLIGDLGNENQNGNEQPFMMDPHFMLELDPLVDPRIRLAWGTRFGTKVARAMTGGSWTAHHSDRSLTPEQNGAIMNEAQLLWGINVVDREPRGCGELDDPKQATGQRYCDPEFARQLGQAAKKYKLGLFFHSTAGLEARVSQFKTVHHASAQALMEGYGATMPGPTPTHPVLDVNLTAGGTFDAMSNEGYLLIVTQYDALVAEAKAWHKRATGQDPNAETLRVMIDIRCVAERYRWITPRAAWTNALPGGVPIP